MSNHYLAVKAYLLRAITGRISSQTHWTCCKIPIDPGTCRHIHLAFPVNASLQDPESIEFPEDTLMNFGELIKINNKSALPHKILIVHDVYQYCMFQHVYALLHKHLRWIQVTVKGMPSALKSTRNTQPWETPWLDHSNIGESQWLVNRLFCRMSISSAFS